MSQSDNLVNGSIYKVFIKHPTESGELYAYVFAQTPEQALDYSFLAFTPTFVKEKEKLNVECVYPNVMKNPDKQWIRVHRSL